ncbi:MAG: protein kinase [Gemmatimonadaceae bacterium]|nr:protein kinase [Gemmatimonadaceae bacterium]
MPKTCASCQTTYPDTMVFCPTDGTSLRADESSGDLVGTVIADRYLVSQLLGEGGMGKVYLASHVRLPQKAAIKVLHQDMVKDAGAVARFNREAANAARIEHDRVARVFDFGETSDGLVYLAMEFVPGKTLRDILNEEQRLSSIRAANIVYQVAEGLDAAHRLSIVHRDLKPDNILVITDDGLDRCKVVDFGIAKVTNGSETQLTQTGMLVGTPEFMSPEQVLGEPLDGRSDVYALALVAYEMFTGALPFEGTTPERKLTARLIQDPRTLADVAPDIEWPTALQQAFDHALMREPDSRTPTAMAFAEAVVAAVEGWFAVPVLRARTPMSSPAITAAANESTASLSRPTPPVATKGVTPPPVKAFTPGAGTSASKQAIPEPVAKKPPVALIAAAVLVIAAVGGYVAMSKRETAPPAVASDAAVGVPTPPSTVAESPTTQQPAAAQGSGQVAAPAAVPVAGAGAPATATGATPTRTETAPASNGASPAPSAATQGVNAVVADEARRALLSIGATLSATADEDDMRVGTRMVPQIQQLLPRLATGSDSADAYIALVTAHAMSERLDRACEPFRLALRLAVTSVQRQTLEGFRAGLTCAP